MKKCLKCNTENPDSFKTCWSCGGELPVSEVREEAVCSDPKQGNIHCREKTPKTVSPIRRKRIIILSGVVGIVLIGFGLFLSRHDVASQDISLFGIKLGTYVDIDSQDQINSLRCLSSKEPIRVPWGLVYDFYPEKKFLSFDDYKFLVDNRTKKISLVMAEGNYGNKASAYWDIDIAIRAIKTKFGVPEAKVEEHTVSTENRRHPVLDMVVYGAERTVYSVELGERYKLEAGILTDGGLIRFYHGYLQVSDKLSQIGKDDVEAL